MNVKRSHSKHVVFAALAGNVAIALTKFVAAWWTGSSAMLSEALHSVVDTSNEGVLLLGMRRAARPANEHHPFGHGMELYFWSFVIALMSFALGGAASIHQGIQNIASPSVIEHGWVNFVVLAACFVFEGLSFRVSWREMKRRSPGVRPWSAIRASKDPSLFAVQLEDAAALVGLLIAFAGLVLVHLFDAPVLDGIASVAIGVVLVVTATFLGRETLSLMTGESASRAVLDEVRATLARDPRVKAVQEVLSLHLGPDSILLAIAIDFRADLTGRQIEAAARELTSALLNSAAPITHVFLRPVDRAPPTGA